MVGQVVGQVLGQVVGQRIHSSKAQHSHAPPSTHTCTHTRTFTDRHTGTCTHMHTLPLRSAGRAAHLGVAEQQALGLPGTGGVDVGFKAGAAPLHQSIGHVAEQLRPQLRAGAGQASHSLTKASWGSHELKQTRVNVGSDEGPPKKLE